MLRSINPANDQIIADYNAMSDQDLWQTLSKVETASQAWRNVPLAKRAATVAKVAELLERDKEALAVLMSTEMGKPLPQSRAEIEKCAWVCRYYGEHGPQFLQPENLPSDASEAFVAFQPIGVVLAIMPWNFPFWQVFRFAIPALVAGNGAILKHAPNVCGCALAIEKMFAQIGLPDKLMQTLLIDHDQTAELIAHPTVAAVTLTGSTRAGKAVAAQAGAHLKKTVLELGGSDPYVVLADADVALAAKTCVTSRLINSGQSCIAAKRFIVVEEVREAFESACHSIMSQKTFGPALEGDFDLGPMARTDLRDQLHDQVLRSLQAGARLALGGNVPAGPGAFYPATLLTGVTPEMAAFKEEIFGPVAAIVPAKDEAQAIALANQTPYGLGAAIFTKDLDRARHLATHAIHAGACFINDFVKSDPRLPFGGIKESGYGRELSSFGIREFVNIKTVVVA